MASCSGKTVSAAARLQAFPGHCSVPSSLLATQRNRKYWKTKWTGGWVLLSRASKSTLQRVETRLPTAHMLTPICGHARVRPLCRHVPCPEHTPPRLSLFTSELSPGQCLCGAGLPVPPGWDCPQGWDCLQAFRGLLAAPGQWHLFLGLSPVSL